MTIITNNVLVGTMDGAGNGTGSGFIPGGVKNITLGTPSEICTAQTGSDIIWDSANAKYYMATAGIGGSSWSELTI